MARRTWDPSKSKRLQQGASLGRLLDHGFEIEGYLLPLTQEPPCRVGDDVYVGVADGDKEPLGYLLPLLA
jgi:hypothetical protein